MINSYSRVTFYSILRSYILLLVLDAQVQHNSHKVEVYQYSIGGGTQGTNYKGLNPPLNLANNGGRLRVPRISISALVFYEIRLVVTSQCFRAL